MISKAVLRTLKCIDLLKIYSVSVDGGGGPDILHVTSSQLKLIMQIFGPHFEKQDSKGQPVSNLSCVLAAHVYIQSPAILHMLRIYFG